MKKFLEGLLRAMMNVVLVLLIIGGFALNPILGILGFILFICCLPD